MKKLDFTKSYSELLMQSISNSDWGQSSHDEWMNSIGKAPQEWIIRNKDSLVKSMISLMEGAERQAEHARKVAEEAETILNRIKKLIKK